MIASITGRLLAKELNTVVIDVGGIGYEVNMAANSVTKLGKLGDTVVVLTYLQVKDDGLMLYGFLSKDEKDLFRRLITVSGVGPKVALSVLSSFEPDRLIAAIATQDAATIQKAPGVGKKMASRIVLELKDAFTQDETLFSQPTAVNSLAKAGALEALLSMGFTQAESELALNGAPEVATEAELLQYALKRLGE